MEDAGFILGSYFLTFATVALFGCARFGRDASSASKFPMTRSTGSDV